MILKFIIPGKVEDLISYLRVKNNFNNTICYEMC